MDFSAIKTLIEQNIRTNNNEDITGSVLQNVLLGIIETLGDDSINDLITALGQEVNNRQNAVQGEADARSQADNTILGKIANILNGGYLYQGIAGVATNPGNPTVSCFYFAKGAGTYTNFRNGDNDPIVITDNGLYALTYEAVENEYWEYNKITDLDDGVFDISRYHASGGTLATYADLSAALGANGVNVPAAFRKGGMSIKYVQSSDNKYVRFNYLLTDVTTAATFTDVANWQGVDKGLIPFSKNLIEGNAVFEGIADSLEEIGFSIPTLHNIAEPYGSATMSSDGTLTVTGSYSGVKVIIGHRYVMAVEYLAFGYYDIKIPKQNHSGFTLDLESGKSHQKNTIAVFDYTVPSNSDVVVAIKVSGVTPSAGSPQSKWKIILIDVTDKTEDEITEIKAMNFSTYFGESIIGETKDFEAALAEQVVDSLNSELTTKPLSAKQGKVLNEALGVINTEVGNAKRQHIFVNAPSSDIMKSVENAVLELYVPQYVEGRTCLNSVRKLQTVGGTLYNVVNIDIFFNGGYNPYEWRNNNANYDFGDGVQLLTLHNNAHGDAYILIDWSKITNGTGYGTHTELAANLLQECANIDRCPIIKCALTESEIPDNVVTRDYLSSVLSGYLSTSTGNNYYANKENTSNLLSQHTSQIGENAQDIETIEQNIAAINSALSSLTSQLPAGAITGDNVWTGQNEFAQVVSGVGGTNDNEFVTFGQVKNTLHRNVDVADFGADPLETAANNTLAINTALSGGNKTVTITKPGVYLLNSSLLIDDNTEFICSKGVVLKKATAYDYVIRNIGAATRSQNSNIILRGINIDCDNKYNNSYQLSSPLYGSRGQILMFHVNNVMMYDITIVNSSVYAIQLCAFYNVLIDGFYITAEGDGVHVNHGNHLVCKNGIIESRDDACPLNASDWIESCPEVGSIHDCHFENIIENLGQSQVGNFARHLVGKWVDWYDGMNIVHGDKVVSNGHVYRAYCNRSSTVFTSHTEPDCDAATGMQSDSGGFTWRYTNEDAIYEASISNITYRNIISNANRTFITAYYETGAVSGDKIYDRSIYPTVGSANYPSIKGVVIDGLVKSNGKVIGISSNIKYQYDFRNIQKIADFLNAATTTFGYIIIEGCDLTNSPNINFDGTNIFLSHCIGVPTLTMTSGKINSDCNVSALPTSNVKGSTCMYNDIPYYNDGTSWVSLLT